MKDIKLRIKSVEGTMQITKAMELVASSKLRKAKIRAENSRPYFNLLYTSLSDVAKTAGVDAADSPYMKEREVKKVCYILIAGDRGLAGGYNSNIFKLTQAEIEESGVEACYLPIGKRSVEYVRKNNFEIISEDFAVVEAMTSELSHKASNILCQGYLEGKFDKVVLVYTSFVSMLAQNAASLTVLPIEPSHVEDDGAVKPLTMYEPSPTVVFDTIIPSFVTGMVFGGVCESLASEFAARRNAMESASKNAGEMIDDLSLKYNRARQAAITQEITEIVGGSEAQ